MLTDASAKARADRGQCVRNKLAAIVQMKTIPPVKTSIHESLQRALQAMKDRRSALDQEIRTLEQMVGDRRGPGRPPGKKTKKKSPPKKKTRSWSPQQRAEAAERARKMWAERNAKKTATKKK